MKKILLALLILFSLFDAAGAAPFQAVTDSQGVLIGYKDVAEGRFIGLDPGHRHTQRVQDWIARGNTLIPADPVSEPARAEKIRRDPSYPTSQEFLEAQIRCRYDRDCSALDAIRSRILELESKYP